MAGSSSTPSNPDKPVIVRVKRKAFHSLLDAFWLEIHERPLKRPLLDFGKLSISDASSSRAGELKIKKVLVRHVETVTSSEDTFDVLQSFVPNSSEAFKANGKNEEGRKSIKTTNKHDQSVAKAKERQDVLSRNARFEQIWRSRNRSKEDPEDEAIHKMCQFYDVVRVDATESEVEVQKEDANLDDCRMMAQYLPLLRDVLPTTAEEIENDISKQGLDGFVYDFYTVEEDTDMVDSNMLFPLVQVDDDDYYDGPDKDSEYETDDSNAEDNPLNDYPDEEESEDEDEATSQSSSNEDSDEDLDDDDESRSSGSSRSGKLENESQASYESEEDSGLEEWSDYSGESAEDENYPGHVY